MEKGNPIHNTQPSFVRTPDWLCL